MLFFKHDVWTITPHHAGQTVEFLTEQNFHLMHIKTVFLLVVLCLTYKAYTGSVPAGGGRFKSRPGTYGAVVPKKYTYKGTYKNTHDGL